MIESQRIAAVMVAALMMMAVLPAGAHEPKKKTHGTTEVQKDIANHRAMADAHLQAVRCFESAGKLTSSFQSRQRRIGSDHDVCFRGV